LLPAPALLSRPRPGDPDRRQSSGLHGSPASIPDTRGRVPPATSTPARWTAPGCPGACAPSAVPGRERSAAPALPPATAAPAPSRSAAPRAPGLLPGGRAGAGGRPPVAPVPTPLL